VTALPRTVADALAADYPSDETSPVTVVVLADGVQAAIGARMPLALGLLALLTGCWSRPDPR